MDSVRFVALGVALLTAACSMGIPQRESARCRMSTGDAAWSRGAMAAWDLARTDMLNLEAASEEPAIFFFDAVCSYRGDGRRDWQAASHKGAVRLPDGRSLPPRVAAFAAPYGHNQRPFLAMALPTLWVADGVASELGVETLMTAVLVHEMTHTRQFYYFAPRLAEMTERYQLPDDLDDDAVQTRFEAVPEFSADILAERDLLFAAAASSDPSASRNLARRVKARIDTRRAMHFVGNDIKYRELEDLFLTMEGVAQWVSYSWLIHPHGGARADRSATLAAFRRGGRRWSQDEGLALFLVIDRLVPDWRRRAFAERPASALELLAEAAE
jgi:hypothetical protein